MHSFPRCLRGSISVHASATTHESLAIDTERCTFIMGIALDVPVTHDHTVPLPCTNLGYFLLLHHTLSTTLTHAMRWELQELLNTSLLNHIGCLDAADHIRKTSYSQAPHNAQSPSAHTHTHAQTCSARGHRHTCIHLVVIIQLNTYD